MVDVGMLEKSPLDKRKKTLSNRSGKMGNTILHRAALCNSPDVAEVLMDYGAGLK